MSMPPLDKILSDFELQEWLNSIEATYVGERVDLASIKDVWIPVIGGSYHYVKETLEAGSHSE